MVNVRGLLKSAASTGVQFMRSTAYFGHELLEASNLAS